MIEKKKKKNPAAIEFTSKLLSPTPPLSFKFTSSPRILTISLKRRIVQKKYERRVRKRKKPPTQICTNIVPSTYTVQKLFAEKQI